MKVFVRTPQYIIPMQNPKYSEQDWAGWCSRFNELKTKVKETFAGFDYDFHEKTWEECSNEERLEVLERRWDDGSLSLWLGSFPEIFFDEQISEEVSEFIRGKMRDRLGNDPHLCNLLIPGQNDYGFGTHRVPLENKYLEVYLQDNVEGRPSSWKNSPNIA